MRLLDLILALVVLAVLVLIARQEFPLYEHRARGPSAPAAAPGSLER